MVDTLVHAIVTHTLRTIEFAALWVKSQFRGQLEGPWIVRGMGGRRGGGLFKNNTQLLQPFCRKAGGPNGNIKHFGDRGADGSFILGVVAKHHIVRHNAALSVGRIGEVIQPRFASERMDKLDSIAHRIHICDGSLQVFVHLDASFP